jgi:hypothetical protein
MAELQAQAYARKWVAKRQVLQTPYMDTVGWILYLVQATNVDLLTDIVNRWIDTKVDREPGTPPLVVGLEHRAIYDGMSKDAQKKMTKDERWAKRAVHVFCKRGDLARAQASIRAFLKSNCFLNLCHVPSKLIPPLPRGAGPIFLSKYQAATLKHMKLTHFGTATMTTFAFTGLDKRCTFLDGKPTIRSLILSTTARGTSTPLFLAVDPATKGHEKGGFVITYIKKFEVEAVEKISNLAAYFLYRYGQDSLERFKQDAIDQAEQTSWDTDNDRPVTIEERFLDDVATEDIEWMENLDDISFGNRTDKTVVILERPSSQLGQPSYPSSTEDDTVQTFFAGQPTAIITDDATVDSTSTTSDVTNAAMRRTSNLLAYEGQRAAHPHPEAQTAESSDELSAAGA